jgi:hypothetical protein
MTKGVDVLPRFQTLVLKSGLPNGSLVIRAT